MNSVKVALFLACKSQFIALRLFDSEYQNLKHVIYIDYKYSVEDEACAVFSQEFYGKLYGYINSSEKKFNCNVCRAFEDAVKIVANHKSFAIKKCAEMFRIRQRNLQSCKDGLDLKDFEQGGNRDYDPIFYPKISNIPVRNTKLLCRQVLVQEIYQSVLTMTPEKRLTVVRGACQIGKT